MQLTEKDKKLLLMLSVVVTLALFWFIGISPLLDKISAQDDRIMELEMQKSELELKIIQKPSFEKALERLTEEYNDMTKTYMTPLLNQQVDAVFTKLALEAGLESEYLGIVMPSDSLSCRQYIYSEAYSSDEEDFETLNFYTPVVNMALNGKVKDILGFIDTVSLDRPDIRIINFSFSNINKDSRTSYEDIVERNMMGLDDDCSMDIQMMLYTYDKVSEEE